MYKCKNSRFLAILSKFSAVTPSNFHGKQSPWCSTSVENFVNFDPLTPMNNTIETLGIFAISCLPTTPSRERCRRLANADALKKHERVNAFNLVSCCFTWINKYCLAALSVLMMNAYLFETAFMTTANA